ncbi:MULTISPECIES: hypothetical protein [Streptomyces]|uniref:hypothetical protein n=1 Tax=Streptomyces TaxID=1883 RepID=UPI000D522C7C|nr:MULTISPECIES: hypothetical protein [Streptomyces]NYS21293.1 hypothetical protein [Streptomyces sp. SJ1-7]PVC63260.1 hypothetical protein DBP15_30205 [Streptomyces sp. CS065A]
MTDHPECAHHGSSQAPSTVWTGRATNRIQWFLALAGAGCMALGIELAVDSPWSSGFTPLLMSVIGCLAAGLLILFGTLAFVHVAVKVDGDSLEVRCGHAGLPRRRILLTHVVGAEYVAKVNPRDWGGWGYRWRPEQGTAVVVRKGEGMALLLGDGRTFTVTVDDAESAVRFIRRRMHLPARAERDRGRD